MCLIQAGPSNTIRSQLLDTAGLIDCIFKKNEDGLGFMFCDTTGLRTFKFLPKTLDEVKSIIETMPDDDRSLSIHWRMQTHGDIDLTNCHPYDIYEGAAIMHNGILATGNDEDKSKSDTWHFVRKYLQMHNTDVLHDPYFRHMLASFIGNNRFTIMSEDGRMSIVNKSQGVEHDGVWYSNTYAWTSSLLIPPKAYAGYGGYGSYYGGSGTGGQQGYWSTGSDGIRKWTPTGSSYGGLADDAEDDAFNIVPLKPLTKKERKALDKALRARGATPARETTLAAAIAKMRTSDHLEAQAKELDLKIANAMADQVDDAMYNYDATTLADCLERNFGDVTEYLFATYEFTEYSRYKPAEWTAHVQTAVAAWLKKDAAKLKTVDETHMAEAVMYCLDFVNTNDQAAGEDEAKTNMVSEIAVGLGVSDDEARAFLEGADQPLETADETPSLSLVQ